MKTYVLPLTDDRGRPLIPVEELRSEPEPGSVVLTQGLHGTAWQRHFSDGWWHCAGKFISAPWEWLINQRNLVLVYDAEPRAERTAGRAGMRVLG